MTEVVKDMKDTSIRDFVSPSFTEPETIVHFSCRVSFVVT